MKVVIIGSGNVATVFGKKILAAGHEITQVVGRNKESTSNLSFILNSTVCYNILEISNDSDIYIISVSDTAVADIVKQLKLNGKIVVHTAASVSKEILNNSTENFGVIYPLQTLKKEVNILPEIPVLVDASNDKTKQIITDFVASWTNSITVASDEERLKLHVAAVMVNNFTNHLFTITKEYLNHENSNFNILEPLIKETIKRIKIVSPMVQTGPAIRNDLPTIHKHLEILAKYPLIQEAYNCMSNNIISYYNNSND